MITGGGGAGGLSVGLNIELPMEQHRQSLRQQLTEFFPTILVDREHWAPLLEWIDTGLEDEGMIAPADLELLVTADTPEEVCAHVRQASEAQRRLA